MRICIKHSLLRPTLVASFILALTGRGGAQVFTSLYNFTTYPMGAYTNTDGANPYAGLVSSGGTLYGTTDAGVAGVLGPSSPLATMAVAFKVLHTFSPLSNVSSGTNDDGAEPQAALILIGVMKTYPFKIAMKSLL